MKPVIRMFLGLALVSGMSLVAQEAEKPVTFKVSAQTFTQPTKWKVEKAASTMRKAQFAVKGKDGKSAEVVFFHFGPGAAGGVKANVQRWLGQFKEPADKLKAKISDETIDGTKVTYVTAEGTFMKGPPFGGNKVPVPDSGLLGAIIGGKQGAVFIKTTGPKATVKSAEKDLKAMITKALKKK